MSEPFYLTVTSENDWLLTKKGKFATGAFHRSDGNTVLYVKFFSVMR